MKLKMIRMIETLKSKLWVTFGAWRHSSFRHDFKQTAPFIKGFLTPEEVPPKKQFVWGYGHMELEKQPPKK